LESCATMAKTWGFDLKDDKYKSTKTLVHFLVKAASKDGNLLLNVGPMPNGEIQPEFVNTLGEMGEWTSKYGETIYGTRGKIIPTQEWGVITAKGKELFVHILNPDGKDFIFIPDLDAKVLSAKAFDGGGNLKFKQQDEGLFIYTDGLPANSIDQIIRLTVK
ncbi:MAG: alpha-L-fucosidase, partial [Cyclobacteriaceae bacterium]